MSKVVGDTSTQSNEKNDTIIPHKVGVIGYDFSANGSNAVRDNSRINLLSLYVHLWPGDWWEQLIQVNNQIQLENKKIMLKRRHVSSVYQKKSKLLKEITENELWVFIGIMVMAHIVGRKGDMWDKGIPEGVHMPVNVDKYMCKYQF